MIRPHPLLLLAATAILPLAAPAFAQSGPADVVATATVDDARSRIESYAQELDADKDGRLTLDEMLAVEDPIFDSMDVDGSGDLTQAEFSTWEFGMSTMAEFRGRLQAYDAAMGIVFDLFDRSDDGLLDRAEMTDAIERSVAYADFDGDGALSYSEYRRGYIVNVALRHAMVAD